MSHRFFGSRNSHLASLAVGLLVLIFAGLGALALSGSSASAYHVNAPGAQTSSPATTNNPSAPAISTNPSILAPADMIVGEADGQVGLTVKLSDSSASTVTVHYATADSSAVSGSGCSADYVGDSGTLTFNPGETSKTVNIQILDCANVENLESFTFSLDTATNGVITRASSRVGIVDNDTIVPTPRLVVRDAVVDEKDGVALVPVLLGGTAGQASNSTVTVNYATSDGTAATGSDYTATSGILSFAPGETVKTVAIPITDDAIAEGPERFFLNLTNANNASISTARGTITIGRSDGTTSTDPEIKAQPDAIVAESDGYTDVTVSLSAPSLNAVSVNYQTLDRSAVGGSGCSADYAPTGAHTLNFAPGETTKVVRVDIFDCANLEGFELFAFDLSTAVNGEVTRAESVVGVVNNDTIVATPKLFVRDTIVDEKDGFALVPVLLGGPAGQASNSTVTVDYTTAAGTATAGSDYTNTSGTLTFAPGETAKTVVVPITDDATAEGEERFSVNLSNPSNADISTGSGTVRIGSSDGTTSTQPAILAPTDQIVGESDGYLDVAVRLGQPSANRVKVHFALADASAVGGSGCSADYEPISGDLYFDPGETTKVVRVHIYDCADVEGSQSLTLNLSSEQNGVITRASGRIGIVDNDTVVATPKLYIRDKTVDEKDGVALVSVLLGGTAGQASNSTVTVDYATTDGSATPGSDYTDVSGTLTFAPGETVKTIVIPIADDATREFPESFFVGLTNATNATIADNSATVEIGASDATSVSQPNISAPFDVGVGEGDGYLDLAVRLSAPSANRVSVNYTTQDVTAVGGSGCSADYLPVSGTLNFEPGETTKVVRVDIFDCANVESAETFHFLLSGAQNGAITDSSTTITIGDNDGVNPSTILNSIEVTPPDAILSTPLDIQYTAVGTYADGHTADITGSVTWASSNSSAATTTPGGDVTAVGGGTTTISATLSGVIGSAGLGVNGAVAQAISFAALPNKTYGDADFTVSATASSGLTVGFTASGNCAVNVTTVHITGAGSCTITANQPGDATYAPATSVPQTFTISKAGQTITFAALAGKKVGDPDFTVSATASSSLAVSFAASGTCTASGATVHLTGAGTCTITASQGGNANFNAATPVPRSFTVAAQTSPPPPPPAGKCKVPNVVGKTLARARALLTQHHCGVGKVTYAYSRAKKKGIVIGQSRRPGRLVAKGTKVNLILSRGRRHHR